MGTLVVPTGRWKIADYKQPENILLGFEYEIDTRQRKSDLQSLIDQHLPEHYSYAFECLDHNDNYGYEIKSSVAPLLRIKTEITSIKDIIYYPIYDKDRNMGGIHINIRRNDYTNDHHEKVFRFLHNTENREWLIILSERTHPSFDMFSPCKGSNSSWSSYYGIITTRKTFAYEFRMFKANPELLIPANEFIHACFELAGKTDEWLTKENLINFMSKYKKYTNIYGLMTKNRNN